MDKTPEGSESPILLKKESTADKGTADKGTEGKLAISEATLHNILLEAKSVQKAYIDSLSNNQPGQFARNPPRQCLLRPGKCLTCEKIDKSSDECKGFPRCPLSSSFCFTNISSILRLTDWFGGISTFKKVLECVEGETERCFFVATACRHMNALENEDLLKKAKETVNRDAFEN